MEDFFKIISSALSSFFSNTYAILSGIVISLIGSLYPIFDIIAFLLFLFALDVFFGAWKAKKIKKESFSMKIVWNTTFPRMMIAFVLIICARTWDDIAKQTLIDSANTIGLIFAGALMWSIAENGYYITKWFAFKVAATKFSNNLKESTGVDIEEESKKEVSHEKG